MKTIKYLLLALLLFVFACSTEPKLKISLAQWSLHKAMFSEELSTLDFPRVTRQEFDLDAVEYVSQFFKDKAGDFDYLQALKDSCNKYAVESLLIMVDGEGSLASTDVVERDAAVENHKKWVDAAKFLGCHSIRVNLHGETDSEDEWLTSSIDGLTKLTAYGASKKINVIVENHGQWSSKGYLVAQVIEGVNSEYCGSLPDFGNFCVRRRDGDLWVSPCVEWYDRYKGVEEMLPYAKGVSSKAFAFDDAGHETTIDFKKMLNLVKKAGYTGYIGIEYEGDSLGEIAGIRKTKALLEKHL